MGLIDAHAFGCAGIGSAAIEATWRCISLDEPVFVKH
jgi:hypothetical protein